MRLHYHLKVVDSPYISGQTPNAYDTFQFLKICSNKSDDIFKIKKGTFFEKLFYARLVYGQKFHAKVFIKINQYLKENTVNPNTTVRSRIKLPDDYAEDVIKPTNTLPEELIVVSLFASKLSFPPEKTWNLPFSMIGWYSSAIALLEGAEVSTNPPQDVAVDEASLIAEWEQKEAERIRLAMVNGKIQKKKIKLSSE